MKDFEKELNNSIKKAVIQINKAHSAVEEVTKIIQRKYPEVLATEVGGENIIFIDDPNYNIDTTMCEYYDLQMVIDKFGVR